MWYNYLYRRGCVFGVSFNALNDIIATLGFPIMISLILIKNNSEQNDDHRQEIKEMHERFEDMNYQFRKEINALHSAIEKNTVTMAKLVENLNERGD